MFTDILSKADFEITKPAQLKLFEVMSDVEDFNDKAVRIYVAGGGCGGMTYGMGMAERAEKSDKDMIMCVTLDHFTGFQVFVDIVALEYLRGSTVDYITDVGRERFVFNNVFKHTGGTGGCNGCGGAQ